MTSTSAVSVRKPQLILCDIEGTTTSITFVKDVLFPYVRAHLTEYLKSTWTSSQTREDIASLWEQYQIDLKTDSETAGFPAGLTDFTQQLSGGEEEQQSSRLIEAISCYVLWAMDMDRKTTALKQLQGNIWQSGYQSGLLKAHVYSEVADQFRRWSQTEQIKLAIYSSGSVLAQQLLFAYSEAGDLSGYICGYFDTRVGAKQEAASYRTISEQLHLEPSAILFLTDIVGEARAATEAGMVAIIVARDATQHTPQQLSQFASVTTFEQIHFV